MSQFHLDWSVRCWPRWGAVEFVLALAGISFHSSVTNAQLKIYYDPATGNVALDTAATRTGALYTYSFSTSSFFLYHELPVPIQFLPDNQIRLTESTLYLANDQEISEASTSGPISGLFTIGNIFPAGLTEEVWSTAFHFKTADPPGTDWWKTFPLGYGYVDAIAQGPPPPAEFIYGAPEGEFDNRWDIVDPATLTWAKTAKLIYRAWSGEVLLDTTGMDSGYISNITLKSDGAFLPNGITPFNDSPINTATPDFVLLVADAVEPGRYSLGHILEAGLSVNEFANLFTEARFIGRAGFNGGSFNFAEDGIDMSLSFVPEPSTLGLLSLGCLTIGCRRRW